MRVFYQTQTPTPQVLLTKQEPRRAALPAWGAVGLSPTAPLLAGGVKGGGWEGGGGRGGF